jgi:hypothetical protein
VVVGLFNLPSKTYLFNYNYYKFKSSGIIMPPLCEFNSVYD